MKFLILFISTLLFIATKSAFAHDHHHAFCRNMLKYHNFFRLLHHSPPLELDKVLTADAQSYAEKLAVIDKLKHTTFMERFGQGENLYRFRIPEPAFQVVKTWYDEVKYYNFHKPGFSSKTGHFTQVVWKDSKKLGCGVAKSKSGWTYIVARYFPSGNYAGHFAKNVLPEFIE